MCDCCDSCINAHILDMEDVRDDIVRTIRQVVLPKFQEVTAQAFQESKIFALETVEGLCKKEIASQMSDMVTREVSSRLRLLVASEITKLLGSGQIKKKIGATALAVADALLDSEPTKKKTPTKKKPSSRKRK